ncbi:hypothetical protein CDAR_546181 [Caerostris darwini]|uniref:Uncharacterized protein n=1 Tax=Caerostris darwini TaxID=1538125 RepID=A0AAV4VG23_9ARAC|nr:hypothetical protein CDAR_546181 [Caerostris darwini]
MRTKRSEECNCKTAGGRTLEKERDSPQIGGLRFSKLAFLCVSLLSQVSIRRGCRRGVKQRDRGMHAQHHFERKLKFFSEKLAQFGPPPPPSRYPINFCGLNL